VTPWYPQGAGTCHSAPSVLTCVYLQRRRVEPRTHPNEGLGSGSFFISGSGSPPRKEEIAGGGKGQCGEKGR
jgi:hypothetical protein